MRIRSLAPLSWHVLTLVLLATSSAFAADEPYNFEMIIFERPGYSDGEYWPDAPTPPDRSLAVTDLEGPDVLPGGAKTLGPVAYTLRQKGIIVHKHLAWRQTPGQRNSQSWQWLDGSRLSGLIRITRGRFLHLDTDLLLRAQDSSEAYRVQLGRRMRSDELHYIDHPKLGIVIRAERYKPPQETPNASDAASGEPKPAQPVVRPEPG